MGDNH